jgi:hypothetical protein
MSTHREPSKPVLIRPLPPRAPESRWSALGRTVPAWMVLSLLPVLAVVLGGALASVSTP